jgi:phosphoribosylglycinamide formyltransferase-1
VNIHPSLLPKFGGQGYYGLKVHQAVIQAGEKETGCTVHLVDGEYDTGKILAQRKLEVDPGESPEELAKRVLKLEHELYPKVLEDLAKGIDPLIT